MTNKPNYLRGAWSMFQASRTNKPNPTGGLSFDHSEFFPALTALVSQGLSGLKGQASTLHSYVSALERVAPNSLSRDEALAYWLNLYNAGSLLLVSEAQQADLSSVLRTPGVFHGKRFVVDGEELSLDDVEHGKVRRFKDPRIHAALVCGSVSCPTLRSKPFTGADINSQLDNQMRLFLASGGILVDRTGSEVSLSKVFQLYGGEFVNPQLMPTLKQPKKWEILASIKPWLGETTLSSIQERPVISFQEYDWSLACNVR